MGEEHKIECPIVKDPLLLGRIDATMKSISETLPDLERRVERNTQKINFIWWAVPAFLGLIITILKILEAVSQAGG